MPNWSENCSRLLLKVGKPMADHGLPIVFAKGAIAGANAELGDSCDARPVRATTAAASNRRPRKAVMRARLPPIGWRNEQLPLRDVMKSGSRT